MTGTSSAAKDGELKSPDRAAEWVARLHSEDCSSADWESFRKWRDGHPANKAAYSSVMENWMSLDKFAGEPEIMKMRLEALALQKPGPRRLAWLAPLAASILMLLGVGLVLQEVAGERDRQQEERIAAQEPAVSETPVQLAASSPAPQSAEPAKARFSRRYSSAVGQSSKIDLPDGSSIELNTDTLIEVSFTARRRDLHLVRGEAVFEVAHDASRPFVVRSGDERVTALGTIFSVRRQGESVVVALIQGSVKVERLSDGLANAGGSEAVRLRPGQQVESTPAADFHVSAVDVDKVLSWRKGRLMFDDEPLDHVIAEANRYSVRKLELGDPGLSNLRVSGTFRTGSIDDLAEALAVALPLAVSEDKASGNLTIQRRKMLSQTR